MFDQKADILYTRVRNRGTWNQVSSMLSRRPRCLLALGEIAIAGTAHAHHCARTQMVPISQIRGSYGRSDDFDRDFNPIQDHTRERWLVVATARRRGKALPPVELIQVGDVYFVLDGHHRISVARALGQQNIEANVTVWQVSGPLPWEESTSARGLAAQKTGVKQIYNKVKADSARLQERLLLDARSLLIAVGIV